MNKIIFIITFIVTSLTQIGNVWAQKYNFEKEKKVSEKHTIQPGDRLMIDNSYGKVQLNTWDKSEITVDITVTTRANTESKAQELLDDISFNIRNEIKTTKRLAYTTVIKGRSNTHAEMQIDYVVNMPKKVLPEIYNRFGNVTIGELDATMLVEISYGNLKTAAVNSINNRIKVNFGDAEIPFMDKGKIEVSYSKTQVDKSNELAIKSMFSDIKITSVQKLDINQRYGDLKMGTVKEFYGNVEFADITMERFADLTLDIKHCGSTNLGIMDAEAKRVSITASFSTVDFSMPENANMDIEMMFRFGDLKNKNGNIILNKSVPENSHNSVNYRGTAGKGEGRMRISSSYSNVRID